jgi:hypothetical protein
LAAGAAAGYGAQVSETSLTILNLYRLTGTPEAFTAAVARLASRVEAEGERGVLAYRFYVDDREGSGHAVIDYASATAWLGHHEIAMGWPEMAALHAVAELVEVTFLGVLTPEIRTWIDNSALTARIRHGSRFAAGFQRKATA